MCKQGFFMISMAIVVLMTAALGLSAQEYSLQFNGDGQYANCGNSPDFNFSNAFTVEAWIYPTDFKEEEHMNTIAAKTIWSFEYSHGWTFRYGSANRSLNFNMGGGVGVNWIDCKANGVLTLNIWQHVAATYDGEYIRLYVNGNRVASLAFAGGIINADEDLCIGSINNPNDMRYMTGKIDEVRIWNVVRTPFEIYNNISQNVTSPNLVAYYKMTNGSGTILTDDSYKGHTADLIGLPTWADEPPREYSLELNGSSQYAICGNQADFYLTNKLTVEAWIYPTDFKEAMHMNTIVAKTHWDPNSYGWTLRYGSSNRTLNFNMSGGGTSWIDCIADNVLTLNTWQHVTATYDGQIIRLYVNGTQVASRIVYTTFRNSSNNLCIGTINNSADMRYMKGLIDEVRIWKVTRSASEIAANMYQCDITDNLLAYYRMTNGSGAMLADNSGHGYNASLVNSPTWNTEYHFFLPTITTEASTLMDYRSFQMKGTIITMGNPNPIQHGFCFNTDPNVLPNIVECQRVFLGPRNSVGEFSSTLWGMLANQEYCIRSYATNRVGSVERTVYGTPVYYKTGLCVPQLYGASNITTTGFTVNWAGVAGYYSFSLDVSTDINFASFVDGYNNIYCGSHNSQWDGSHSFIVSGLEAGSKYYYRIRSSNSTTSSSPSNTKTVTTLAAHNVSYNTGNITGVRIYTADTDYGIDPPIPLVFPEGYTGTILAEKDGYIWNLADGSDSNVLSNLSSGKSISFIGTYRYDDPANPGFVYQGDPDIAISVSNITLEDLSAPLPPLDPVEAIVLNFTGTAESDITISVPVGTWYAIAYYDDPADGGLEWHHANLYPADGPGEVVFANVSFGAKSDVPVIISGEDATLPVEFSSFTAFITTTQDVTLSWTTQSETNLSGYALLRSITNGLSGAMCISDLIPATNSSQQSAYTFTDTDSEVGSSYYYWILIRDLDGSETYHGPISVTVDNQGFEPPAIPLQTRLLSPYPNPFNPTTTIRYELSTPETVTIAVYNAKGQIIATHNRSHSVPGAYHWVFSGVDQNGRALSSGVYYCVMHAGKHVLTNKMVLLK